MLGHGGQENEEVPSESPRLVEALVHVEFRGAKITGAMLRRRSIGDAMCSQPKPGGGTSDTW